MWRLRKDVSTIADKNLDCFTEVRKAENLYSKDIHYRSVGRNEYVSVQTTLNGTHFPVKPILKYFYMSHCKGYRWSYVPKPKTSSALFVEYTELRDIFVVDDLFYGVFSSPFANEQLHTSKLTPDGTLKPHIGSAICSFSLSDIQSTFDGPFKKKDKNTGNYRPYGKRDTSAIRPSPYSKENDVIAEQLAGNIKNMTINFLDPTQPYSREIRNIDLRERSSRVNFFEEDVFGSRTMWNDVKTEPMLSENGVVFEQVVGQVVGDTTFLYVATSEGLVYKIANTRVTDRKCRMTDKTKYFNWLNNTKSMSSIWDNEFYAYFNRTVDSVTFATSFKSDLTMEKGTKFPDDMLIESDWDCTPSAKSTILAVFKPFGEVKTKIWDMKISGEGISSTLILASDERVVQIPSVQCGIYTHCTACTSDPQCSWVNESCAVGQGLSNKAADACACKVILKMGNVGEDIVLPGLSQPSDLSLLQWYRNGTKLKYQPSRVMLSHDTSLILFNIIPSNAGMYELRQAHTNKCLARYQVELTACNDEVCRYQIKYQEWCNEYDNFLGNMNGWMDNYKGFGFCSNLN